MICFFTHLWRDNGHVTCAASSTPSPLRFCPFSFLQLHSSPDCDGSVMTNETAKPKPKNSEATKEHKDSDFFFLYCSQYQTLSDTKQDLLLHHQEFILEDTHTHTHKHTHVVLWHTPICIAFLVTLTSFHTLTNVTTYHYVTIYQQNVDKHSLWIMSCW